jgi:hypothetical protein
MQTMKSLQALRERRVFELFPKRTRELGSRRTPRVIPAWA